MSLGPKDYVQVLKPSENANVRIMAAILCMGWSHASHLYRMTPRSVFQTGRQLKPSGHVTGESCSTGLAMNSG